MSFYKKPAYSPSSSYKRPYNPNYVRRPYVKTENTFGYKKNEMIQAANVKVIDTEGENLGEMTLTAAIALARENDYDLVEIVPNSNPPVCKIVEWEKFRYEIQKKRKQPKTNIEMKGMWFGVNVGDGDLNHKVERILEFISEKHPVKIEIRAKGGRQVPGIFQIVMNKILAILGDKVRVDGTPKFEGGRRFSVVVHPQTGKKVKTEVSS